MAFKPIQKLTILRTLSNGQRIDVGVLAQNRQGVFFQYDAQYLAHFGNLSPFTLQSTTELQQAPKTPHQGLHGVFADCLPDGWGLLLQDRVFRQHGLTPSQITPMDRLAFVGHRSVGALSFEPVSEWALEPSGEIDLATLGLEAQAVFDGQTDHVLAELVAAGSSGGARPKAQIFMPPNQTGQTRQCRTKAQAGDQAWLVKFTSKNLALGHEEGLCEAAYLTLAKAAELAPVEWTLLDAPAQSGATHWLAVKRFDWVNEGASAGRHHTHSACGLLDADFRSPSLDYADLIKASRQVCKAPAVGQLQFKRALFNLFGCNQDDHSKNWAFLQDDQAQWQVAPFFDVTFSPHPFGEHTTAFSGYGKAPPLKTIQALASRAGFSDWKHAQQAIAHITDQLGQFADLAQQLGIKPATSQLIQKRLNQAWLENKHLLQPR
ncbi:MAG: type II toxin-antitoxin system HipA family toxin [Thiomicrospira sp.]